jgi:hypothetical protein
MMAPSSLSGPSDGRSMGRVLGIPSEEVVRFGLSTHRPTWTIIAALQSLYESQILNVYQRDLIERVYHPKNLSVSDVSVILARRRQMDYAGTTEPLQISRNSLNLVLQPILARDRPVSFTAPREKGFADRLSPAEPIPMGQRLEVIGTPPIIASDHRRVRRKKKKKKAIPPQTSIQDNDQTHPQDRDTCIKPLERRDQSSETGLPEERENPTICKDASTGTDEVTIGTEEPAETYEMAALQCGFAIVQCWLDFQTLRKEYTQTHGRQGSTELRKKFVKMGVTLERAKTMIEKNARFEDV